MVTSTSAKLAVVAFTLGTSIGINAQLLNPANGHYYQLVSTTTDWSSAIMAAESMTFNGWRGYLVTVTDQTEQDFITTHIPDSVLWAGGSDSAVEGEWRWVTGPEAGTMFWKAGIGTITYSNWNSAEPNNNGGTEDTLIINVGSGWNDGNSCCTGGYIVEFSAAVPESSTVALLLFGIALLGAAHGLPAVVRHRGFA